MKRSSRDPKRTLREAVDLHTMATIPIEALMEDRDRFHEIRREATISKRAGSARYACGMCGYPVYAPVEPTRKLPFWAHFRGAPESCLWWTGETQTPDQVSASQFQGNQESPLHHRIKHQVAELLQLDARTDVGSIIVDAYLIGESGSRRPDVRAEYDGRPVAFEIQLASTQLPIILDREQFYAREKRHLIWLTWQFDASDERPMLMAFEDIFYSHNKNIFSLDGETLHISRSTGTFTVRCFWQVSGEWRSKLVRLPDLQWPGDGKLPFAIAPPLPWHLGFRSRWSAALTETGMHPDTAYAFLTEIAKRFDSHPASLELMKYHDFITLCLSLLAGRPLGSRQTQLVEQINTFLTMEDRQCYATLVKLALEQTGHAAFLQRPSVARKIELALERRQITLDERTSRIAAALFPDIFAGIITPLPVHAGEYSSFPR